VRCTDLIFAALVISLQPAAAQKRSPAARQNVAAELKALDGAYKRAEAAFYKATSPSASGAVPANRVIAGQKQLVSKFVPQFLALAARHRGTETATEALLRAVEIGDEQEQPQASIRAFSALMAGSLKSANMEEVANYLQFYAADVGADFATTQLRKLAEVSRHKSVQAAALAGIAKIAMAGGKGSPAQRREAGAIFARLKRDYAGSSYAKEADAHIYELERLQIGMTAPEIDGVDTEGARFRLSDYRGKVVVLVFWGFW
jgi:hypothetical protein